MLGTQCLDDKKGVSEEDRGWIFSGKVGKLTKSETQEGQESRQDNVGRRLLENNYWM